MRAPGVHLKQWQMLSYTGPAGLISELFGMPVLPTTLLAWVGKASTKLAVTAKHIARQLHHAQVLCADES